MPHVPPIRLEELTRAEELAALAQEWATLWDRCPAATLFQTPEWLLPWWKHLGRGRLWVLTFRRGERLVGLAPLFLSRYFGLPLRRVGLVGTGHTDYLDLLVEPGCAGEVAGRVLEHLAARRERWDFCDFQQLPPGSALLAASPPDGFQVCVMRQEVCPYFPLPQDPGELAGVLPSRMRSNVRYYSRRLARETSAAFGVADGGTLDAALNALFALHQGRWNRRLLPGAFASPRVRAFHREAVAGFLERGWLRLHTLTVAGAIKAALYCFADNRRGYYYSGGFHTEVARYSPGTLLVHRAMEDAVRSGAAEFDFLRGSEPYKYLWGAVDRWNSRLLVGRPGFRGSLGPYLNRFEVRMERAGKSAADRLVRLRT